ncbi:MAG: TonB-dependent siderophore receptor, partial [Thiohalorhabdaceae bacterium]
MFPVTMQSVKKVDIVRGGAAVHYGPNNVGGVMNLVTRSIPLEFQQSVREQVSVAEETGNVLTDSYYQVGGSATDNLALQFQANTVRGKGPREHSDTQADNFILDGLYFLGNNHEIQAKLQRYQVDAELPGALSPEAYKADRTRSQRPHDRFEADMTRGTLTWRYTASSQTQFQWRNFAHDADRTFFFGQNLSGNGHWADPARDATHVADSPRPFTVYGTEPRLTQELGNHTVTLGARYVREDVDFIVNREELA